MSLTFGEKIKAARKIKEFTQKQLAEKIGAKHNSVSDWENDKNKPDPDTIEVLCGVLEITPNYLLDTLSSSDEFSPLEKSIIKKYRSLDNHGKEHVETILEWESKRMETIEKVLTEKEQQLAEKNSLIIELEAAIKEKQKLTRLTSYFLQKASAGSGNPLSDDMIELTLEIPDNDYTSNADFVIGVSGDSMEPTYCDGDKLLISRQDKIEVGQIGVFIINNDSFVKELGNGELISHNKAYPNIQLHEGDTIRCVGQVIGRLQD